MVLDADGIHKGRRASDMMIQRIALYDRLVNHGLIEDRTSQVPYYSLQIHPMGVEGIQSRSDEKKTIKLASTPATIPGTHHAPQTYIERQGRRSIDINTTNTRQWYN